MAYKHSSEVYHPKIQPPLELADLHSMGQLCSGILAIGGGDPIALEPLFHS